MRPMDFSWVGVMLSILFVHQSAEGIFWGRSYPHYSMGHPVVTGALVTRPHHHQHIRPTMITHPVLPVIQQQQHHQIIHRPSVPAIRPSRPHPPLVGSHHHQSVHRVHHNSHPRSAYYHHG